MSLTLREAQTVVAAAIDKAEELDVKISTAACATSGSLELAAGAAIIPHRRDAYFERRRSTALVAPRWGFVPASSLTTVGLSSSGRNSILRS